MNVKTVRGHRALLTPMPTYISATCPNHLNHFHSQKRKAATTLVAINKNGEREDEVDSHALYTWSQLNVHAARYGRGVVESSG